MGNKFILILGTLSLVFLSIIVSSHGLFHYHHSINDQKIQAQALVQTIAKSIDLPMLRGEMDIVQEMLVTVGELKNIRRVHITDENGIIGYSSDPKRIKDKTGSEVIKESIQRDQVIERFEHRGKDFIYSLAIPLHNEKRCHSCHGNEKELLGILRLGIDWTPIRASLMRVYKEIFLLL